jgi:hypothetical protein
MVVVFTRKADNTGLSVWKTVWTPPLEKNR